MVVSILKFYCLKEDTGNQRNLIEALLKAWHHNEELKKSVKKYIHCRSRGGKSVKVGWTK